MGSFRFFSLHWLALLPVVAWAVWQANRPRLRAAALYSQVDDLKKLPVTLAQRLKRLLPWVHLLGMVLLVVAFARPQVGKSESRVSTEGIAIELVLDVPGSMKALDFNIGEKTVSRIAAVRHVVNEFINGSKASKLPGRKNDLIGLVSFGGFVDSRCPPTLDHGALTKFVETLDVPKQLINTQRTAILNQEEFETAIGDGLLGGANRLKEVTATSKILILLTDGANSMGNDPREAAKAVETEGIKVYTICIGTNDIVPYPAIDRFGNEYLDRGRFPIDEKVLQDIAETCHGRYFRAYGTEALTDVYAEIDQLEKSKVDEARYTQYTELFPYFLIPGLALLLSVFALGATRFRTMP